MKLSEKKRQELYDAIADAVMDMRLHFLREGLPDKAEVDDRLFRLTSDIWRGVHSALNLEGPP